MNAITCQKCYNLKEECIANTLTWTKQGVNGQNKTGRNAR